MTTMFSAVLTTNFIAYLNRDFNDISWNAKRISHRITRLSARTTQLIVWAKTRLKNTSERVPWEGLLKGVISSLRVGQLDRDIMSLQATSVAIGAVKKMHKWSKLLSSSTLRLWSTWRYRCFDHHFSYSIFIERKKKNASNHLYCQVDHSLSQIYGSLYKYAQQYELDKNNVVILIFLPHEMESRIDEWSDHKRKMKVFLFLNVWETII